MSRRAAGAVLTTLMVMALAIPVLASGYSYADDFGSGGYEGSTGSEVWTAPWTEVGESNGPKSGSVTVTDSDLCTLSPCLVVQGLVGVTNVGASRRITLHQGDTAELRYDIDFPGGVLVQGSALVQASADGGSWQTLSTHSPGAGGTFRVSLPKASSTIDVRFVTSGLSLLGSMAIDSVVATVDTPATTTTTTTVPVTVSSSTPVTNPTTLTVPTTTLTIPTTTPTSPSTTLADGTSSTSRPTSTLTDRNDSTTSATDRSTTTTTTTNPSRGNDPSTTTSTTVRKDGGLDSSPPPPGDSTSPPSPPAPPSQTSGVVTRLDPGLGTARIQVHAQENLAVRFVRASEHLGFDIVANLVLGAFLAWASVTGLERRRSTTRQATETG